METVFHNSSSSSSSSSSSNSGIAIPTEIVKGMHDLRQRWPWLNQERVLQDQGKVQIWGHDMAGTRLGFMVEAHQRGVTSKKVPVVYWELYTKRLSWELPDPKMPGIDSARLNLSPYVRIATNGFLESRPNAPPGMCVGEALVAHLIPMDAIRNALLTFFSDILDPEDCEMVVSRSGEAERDWSLGFCYGLNNSNRLRFLLTITQPSVTQIEHLHYEYRSKLPDRIVPPIMELDPVVCAEMPTVKYEDWLLYYAAAPEWRLVYYVTGKREHDVCLMTYKGYNGTKPMREAFEKYLITFPMDDQCQHILDQRDLRDIFGQRELTDMLGKKGLEWGLLIASKADDDADDEEEENTSSWPGYLGLRSKAAAVSVSSIPRTSSSGQPSANLKRALQWDEDVDMLDIDDANNAAYDEREDFEEAPPAGAGADDYYSSSSSIDYQVVYPGEDKEEEEEEDGEEGDMHMTD